MKRNLIIAGLWPHWLGGGGDNDVDVWQEMEQDPVIREKMKRLALDEADELSGT
jgi:phospholipid-translocating ATPase